MPPFEATFKHGLLLREGFLAPQLVNSGVHAGSCARPSTGAKRARSSSHGRPGA